MKEIELFRLLGSENQLDWEKATRYLYVNHRTELLQWATQKFRNLDEHGRNTVFNESLLALRTWVLKGQELDFSGGDTVKKLLKTFNYRLALKYLKTNNRETKGWDNETTIINQSSINSQIDQLLIEQEEVKEAQRLISNLSPACERMLTLFYLMGLTLEEICQKLKTVYDSAKAQKSRCLKKLKEEAGKNPILKGYLKRKENELR